MQYNKCPVCDTSMRKGAKCRVCGYSESTDYELHKTLGPIGYERSTIGKNIEYKKRTSDAVEKKHQEEMENLNKKLAEMEVLKKRLAEVENERQGKALEEAKRKQEEEERKESDRRREAEKQRKEQKREKETSKGDKRKLGMIGGGLVALAAVVLIAGKLLGGSGTEGTNQSGANTSQTKGLETEESTKEEENTDTITADVKVGDVVCFGKYEQDNNKQNGREAIEWNVLAVEDGKALIQSVYGLWVEVYNEEFGATTWEECTLRASMNGSFYMNAFDDEEKKQIEKTVVKAENNPDYDTNAGNDTEDYVFLLSIQEAEKYYKSDEARKCKATEYAKANDAYVNDDTKCSWWWLRSPGSRCSDAALVSPVGSVDYYGDDVSDDTIVVRPALWINL